MARKQNVVRMHHGLNLNIGIVIFVIIIIYVIFNLISYLTSSPVAEYEVGQGTIATNHVYHGLILRDETVVYAGQSGYINYYLKNGAKASVNDVVYSIDTSGELSRQISDVASNGDTLDTETLNEVSSELDVFRNSYDSNTFSSVYTFKNELNAQLTQTLSMNALSSLNEDVKTAVENNTFYKKSRKNRELLYITRTVMKVSPQTTLLLVSLTWQITKEIPWMTRNRSRQILLPTNGLTVKNGIFCCRYQRIWQNS